MARAGLSASASRGRESRCETDQQRQAAQPPRQHRRCQVADHPSGDDDPFATHTRRAGPHRRDAGVRAVIGRHRGCPRYHCRSRSGPEGVATVINQSELDARQQSVNPPQGRRRSQLGNRFRWLRPPTGCARSCGWGCSPGDRGRLSDLDLFPFSARVRAIPVCQCADQPASRSAGARINSTATAVVIYEEKQLTILDKGACKKYSDLGTSICAT